MGWAIVADPEVAKRMRRYLVLASMWSYENQLRAATLLEHVLATHGALLLHLAHSTAPARRALHGRQRAVPLPGPVSMGALLCSEVVASCSAVPAR